MSEATQILNQIEQGDPSAAEQLLPLVYRELRKLAAAKLAQEKPGQTLQSTALVHEAYLKLVGGQSNRSYHDRRHFLTAAGTAMRQIVIDRARAKRSLKRGGDLRREPLADVAEPQSDAEVLSLHEALDRLQANAPLEAKLVELRFFVGLTGEQAAEVLGISPRTAERHWVFARAWLHAEVRGT
jgi:RNA polymerase sigma factor (TIGR02999 family)